MRAKLPLATFLSILIVMLPVCFSAAITYDANGNTVYTASDNLYRVYNSENKLWKIYNGTNESGTLLEDYTYDLVDERVLMKKIYNSSGIVIEKDIYVTPEYIRIKNSSGTYDQMIVTHEGANIAQVNADNSTYFMLTDHLGSSSIVVGNANPVPQNNLVSYYPFDLNANDNVSQNNGVVSGAILVTGKLNNAYSFNGTNTRINLTRPFISFNSSSACAWLNISNPAKVGSAAYSQTALNLYKDSNNSLRLGNDEAGSGGAIFIGYRYNGVEYGRETAQQVISANTFTFVCYTFNGTNLNLYVNAVDSDIVANSNSAGIASIVGGRSQTVGNWNGTIDELYLWNRSLSQTEITQIYNKYSIDGVNQIIESNSYTPFGSLISGGTSTRFDYTGQEFESSLNQYDYHARMYRADWGRFLTPDTLMQNVYDPQLLNRYAYARNNPWRYIDTNGHESNTAGQAALGAGGLVSAVYDIIKGESLSARYFFLSLNAFGHGQSIQGGRLLGKSASTSLDAIKRFYFIANMGTNQQPRDPQLSDILNPSQFIMPDTTGDFKSTNNYYEQIENDYQAEKNALNAEITQKQSVNNANLVQSDNLLNSLTHSVSPSLGGVSRISGGGVSYTNEYGRETRLCSTCSITYDSKHPIPTPKPPTPAPPPPKKK